MWPLNPLKELKCFDLFNNPQGLHPELGSQYLSSVSVQYSFWITWTAVWCFTVYIPIDMIGLDCMNRKMLILKCRCQWRSMRFALCRENVLWSMDHLRRWNTQMSRAPLFFFISLSPSFSLPLKKFCRCGWTLWISPDMEKGYHCISATCSTVSLTVPGENHTNPLDQSTLILTRVNSPTC